MTSEPAPAAAIQATPRAIVTLATDYPAGHKIAPHHHPRGQLVHAAAGLMTVGAGGGTWVVPTGFAVWVPPGLRHWVRAVTRLEMRTLYVARDVAAALPGACRVVAVPPLLRELILEMMTLPLLYDMEGPEGRLVAVVIDRLRGLEEAPLHLPLPRDRRLSVVTEGLLERPGDERSLAAWGGAAGASPRTLARLFVRETGMSFGHWRQRRRLLAALEQLAAGRSVTALALDLGYDSPSAFIAMFKRETGETPRRYLDARRGGTPQTPAKPVA